MHVLYRTWLFTRATRSVSLLPTFVRQRVIPSKFLSALFAPSVRAIQHVQLRPKSLRPETGLRLEDVIMIVTKRGLLYQPMLRQLCTLRGFATATAVSCISV
jgi:hypothetical protein